MLHENECSSRLAGRVMLLAGTVESSSLYLLRAIEETLSSLRQLEDLARSTTSNVLSLAEEIPACPVEPGMFLDPDGTAVAKLESALRELEKYVPVIESKKASIDGDDNLRAHHCDVLHAAYASYLNTLESLTESIRVLRAAVIRHDLKADRNPATVTAILEARQGEFETVPENESLLDCLTE